MYQVYPELKKSINISRPFKKENKLAFQKSYSPEDNELNWEWYSPPQESVAVRFCLDTSLHGLKFLGQEKRHFFERLFWLVAFMASVITAGFLIWGAWKEYRNMPIITVFNPTEKNLDAIPFPSVTVCNVNGLQKSTFDQQLWKTVADLGKSGFEIINETQLRSLAEFVDMNYICDSSLTFIDKLVGNTTILQWIHDIKVAVSKNMQNIEKYLDPIATLRKVSQPCHKMILHCMWLDEVANCSELFQEIETDYGYCCTFNTVPMSLLWKNNSDNRDNPEVVKAWKDANLDTETLMFTKDTENRTYPFRQRYPSKSAGLTFLLDPDLKEYFCTNLDSEGFIIGINIPLDFPRIKDDGIAIKTNSEVFVGIRPDIAMSDDSVIGFPLEKRHCYYGNEFDLPHYTMYTTSNCMNECLARKTLEECKCTSYYLPHDENDEFCKPDKYNCTQKVQASIMTKGLRQQCNECLPPCTEISYQKEVAVLKLRDDPLLKLWLTSPEKFEIREVSIVHVYFVTDSVYPKLRKREKTLTELLSNTGGLLGLCMGFSVLSLLEILYFGTLRLFCKFYREKVIRDKKGKSKTNESHRRENNSDLEFINPKHLFPTAFNKTSLVSTIDCHRNESRPEIGECERVFNLHKRENLPAYYNGTMDEQYHEEFLTNFSKSYV